MFSLESNGETFVSGFPQSVCEMEDHHVRLLQIEWERIVEAAGSKAVLSGRKRVPADRRDGLAIALGSLRIVIRNIPEAEARLQSRFRWVNEHAGPGTQFHKQLEAVVVALAEFRFARKLGRDAFWDLRSAAAGIEKQDCVIAYRYEKRPKRNGALIFRRMVITGSPIRLLSQLRQIETALRRLSHLPNAHEQISAAMKTADQLIKTATSKEVEAAVALDGIDELASEGRFGAIGDVGIVDSIPLGAVGRLVQQILVEPSPDALPNKADTDTDETPEGPPDLNGDEEWSKYRSPKDWRDSLELAEMPSGETYWLKFKRDYGGEDHPSSGNRLVRFRLSQLRKAGLPEKR